MKYTPQIISARDASGNARTVAVTYDRGTNTYIGTITGGKPRRMVSGSMRPPILALGEGYTPPEAVACAIAHLNARS
jgi:hypothetical protein